MDFEKEIFTLKERIAIAEQDGRNPLAIQGKFENAFQLISNLQNEISELRGLIGKLKEEKNIENDIDIIILEKENEEKRKPGRPKREV